MLQEGIQSVNGERNIFEAVMNEPNEIWRQSYTFSVIM